MTDPDDETSQVPVLPYARPMPQTQQEVYVSAGLGCQVYAGLCVTWFAASILFSVGIRIFIYGLLVITSLVLGAGLFLRLRYRVRGFAYGVLVFLLFAVLLLGGIALLIIGVCGGFR